MVDWLLARGADVSMIDRRFNVTAAGCARYFGHDKLAEPIEVQAHVGFKIGGWLIRK